jgi:hypothetical protein
LNGEINLLFEKSLTGFIVKEQLKSILNIPIEKLVLVYKYRLIDNNKSFSSQGILDNSEVYCLIFIEYCVGNIKDSL